MRCQRENSKQLKAFYLSHPPRLVEGTSFQQVNSSRPLDLIRTAWFNDGAQVRWQRCTIVSSTLPRLVLQDQRSLVAPRHRITSATFRSNYRLDVIVVCITPYPRTSHPSPSHLAFYLCASRLLNRVYPSPLQHLLIPPAAACDDERLCEGGS